MPHARPHPHPKLHGGEGGQAARLHPCPLAQVRDAYLKFMVSVATMLRADMHLPENHLLVQKDMAQVLKLETHIANVRPGPRWRAGRAPLAPATAPGHCLAPAGHSPPGGAARRHRPVPQDEGEGAPEQVRPEGEGGRGAPDTQEQAPAPAFLLPASLI